MSEYTVSNKQQPLPSLAPERDQVEAFKSSRSDLKSRPKPPSGGSGSTFANVMIYILLLLLMAGGWWFDLQNKQLQEKLDSADARIQDLERQLSATGEEMGESAVVIKARLQTLGEKTDELWEQMDKLWASAWRRNQADIKALETDLKKQQSRVNELNKSVATSTDSIKAVADKQTQTDFNVGILTEQLDGAKALQAELKQLKADVQSIQSKAVGKEQDQIEVAASVASLERQLTALTRRIQTLETGAPPTN